MKRKSCQTENVRYSEVIIDSPLSLSLKSLRWYTYSGRKDERLRGWSGADRHMQQVLNFFRRGWGGEVEQILTQRPNFAQLETPSTEYPKNLSALLSSLLVSMCGSVSPLWYLNVKTNSINFQAFFRSARTGFKVKEKSSSL